MLSPEAGGAMVEVFGLWQTEDYQPPPVVNVSGWVGVVSALVVGVALSML